jgi:predicted nucleic acid-binding protein
LIIADTSGLLAFFNSAEPLHDAVRELVEGETDPIVVSPYVIAELDYLVVNRIGVHAELAVLAELASGAYDLAQIDSVDLRGVTGILRRYVDQAVGVTDASLVLLADKYSTRRILTLDHRHFSVLRPLTGGHFSLLP